MTARCEQEFVKGRYCGSPALVPAALKSALKTAAVLASALMLPMAVVAQSDSGTGELTLTPVFKASTQADKPTPLQSDTDNPTWMNLVDAGMALRFSTPLVGWEVSYQAAAARHEINADEKYLDHSLSGRGSLDLGEGHTLEVKAARDVTHEDRGRSRSRGMRSLLQSLETFARTEVGVTYQYGGESEQQPLGAKVVYSGLDYQSVESDDDQSLGYNEAYLAGTFSLQLVQESTLLVEVSRLEVANDSGHGETALASSTRDSVLTGFTWQSPGVTSGSVKLGYLRRALDTQQQGVFTAPNWEVELAWTPDPFSTIKVESHRYDQETRSGDDIIDTRRYGLDWTHQWRNKWSLQIAGTYLDEVFNRLDREQNTVQVDTALRYAMDEGLQWSLGYRWQDRDSNIERLRMGRNQLQFSASVVF